MRIAILVCISLFMAGCASEPATEEPSTEVNKQVAATSTTGGIRGVVVDETLTPLSEATVTILGQDKSTETDSQGVFVFSGLTPGFYQVQATAPLYDVAVSQAEVVAGVTNPPAVRIQLSKITDTIPYAPTLKYDGYLFCSLNIVVPDTTYLLSEECGEGVGVPGHGRVGGNPDNAAQLDFTIDSSEAKTMQAEVIWTPSVTLGVTGAFNMGIYTDFVCDPGCGWTNQIDRNNGNSPLLLRSDNGQAEGFGLCCDMESFADAGFDETTQFSTFTWASSDETGILLEQRFTMYQTTSYVLPLPDAWTFSSDTGAPF